MPTQILLPPGRIVEGNVYKASSVGMNGQPKAKPEFYFALAISKGDPNIGNVWNAMLAEARAGYATNGQVMARINAGLGVQNGFRFKIVDGDAPDRVQKPGNAGCWIFKIKTTWQIKVVDANNQPIDPALLRTGFYADALINVTPNGKQDHTAGLYLNPVFVRWLFPQYGQEIQGGPQADQVMGAAPSVPPPGAVMGGGMGGQPQQGQGYPASQHQPGGMGGHVPPMGNASGQPQAQQAPNVGYQAPSPAPHSTPQGWGNPANAQQNPGSPGMSTGTSSPHAMHAAQHGQYSAPGGQPGGMTHPTQSQGAMTPGVPQAYASIAGGPSTAPTPPQAGMTTAYPSNLGNGPASDQGAPGGALPAGAHYTPAQQASPTAYPSEAPPLHGFAHGAPNA